MKQIFIIFAVLLWSAQASATDVTYADKSTGGSFTAADANEIKTAVNSKMDESNIGTGANNYIQLNADGDLPFALGPDTTDFDGIFSNDTDHDTYDELFNLLDDMDFGAAPTIQADDPTAESTTGWYLATTSGDTFYKAAEGLFNVSAGTYTLGPVPPTAPTMIISGAGPQVATFTYAEAVTASTTADLCDDWPITMTTAGALTLAYSSGDTTDTIVCSISEDVFTADTVVSASYTPGTIAAVDDSGALAAIADFSSAITNSSSEEGVAQCNDATDYIGYTADGVATNLGANARMYIQLVSPTAVSGCASGDTVTAYIWHGDTTAQTAKVCLYLDDGDGARGGGDTIVGSCVEASSSSVGFVSASFGANAISASSDYWIGFIPGSAGWATGYDTAATSAWYDNQSDNYTAPKTTLTAIGAWTEISSRVYSMYITVGP